MPSVSLAARPMSWLRCPMHSVTFQGTVFGTEQHLYRSGLLDSVYRFSVNLKGGPAMPPQKFVKWHQKVLLGASLKVSAPTGQYDPTKLINWGANRWGFKPEFGYSQRWGKWILDGYFGVWFFTTNNDFWSRNMYYAGTRNQSQNPYWGLRRTLELRLREVSSSVGFARRQLLVRRGNKCERCAKLTQPSDELPDRRHSLGPHHQTPPVSEVQLQRRHLYPVWRQLPERFGGVAVFLAGQTELGLIASQVIRVIRERGWRMPAPFSLASLLQVAVARRRPEPHQAALLGAGVHYRRHLPGVRLYGIWHTSRRSRAGTPQGVGSSRSRGRTRCAWVRLRQRCHRGHLYCIWPHRSRRLYGIRPNQLRCRRDWIRVCVRSHLSHATVRAHRRPSALCEGHAGQQAK